MGLWSEEKCSFCQYRLKVYSIFAALGHLLLALVLPFGFVAGLEVFQLFLGSEQGLCLGCFILGGLLGMMILGFFVLWLFYLLVPLVSNYAK